MPNPRPKTRHFRNLADSLKRQGWYVLVAVLTGLVAAGLLVLLLPRRYESSFVIELVDPALTEAGVRSAVSSTAPGEVEVRVTGGAGRGIRVVCAGSDPEPVGTHCARMLASLTGRNEGPAGAGAPDSLEAEARRVAASVDAARDSLIALRREMEAEAGARSRGAAAARTEQDRLSRERAATTRLIDDLAQGGRSHLDLARYPPAVRGSAAPLVRALSPLEARRASLAETRSARNPDLVAIDRQIGATRNRLRSLLVRREATLRDQVRSASTAVRSAGGPSEAAREQAERLEGRIARLDGRHRELVANFDAPRPEPKLPPGSVRVLREASEPGEPSTPDAAPLLAWGAVIGLAVGLAGAILRERADVPLRTPDEIRATIDLPVLLVLPVLRGTRPLLPVRPRAPAGAPLRPARASRRTAALLSALDTLPSRIDMMRWATGIEDLHAVAITSAARGRESTLLACNLALIRAARGVPTLLVEGDFEDDGLARFFRLPRAPAGLLEVLDGQGDLEAACFHFTAGENGRLAVLSRGRSAVAAPPRRGLKETLDAARQRYDAIVVAAPPYDALGPALPIASAVDAVLLLVTAGTIRAEGLKRAVERIRKAGGRLLGIIVMDPKEGS